MRASHHSFTSLNVWSIWLVMRTKLCNFLVFWLSISQLIVSVVKSATFQLPLSTEVTGLVRDRKLEDWQLRHEAEESVCLAWVSADCVNGCCCKPVYLPLDEYWQPLCMLSVHAESEIDHPAILSSGPNQPPLHTATAAFQVGQGHEGICCYKDEWTEKLSV